MRYFNCDYKAYVRICTSICLWVHLLRATTNSYENTSRTFCNLRCSCRAVLFVPPDKSFMHLAASRAVEAKQARTRSVMNRPRFLLMFSLSRFCRCLCLLCRSDGFLRGGCFCHRCGNFNFGEVKAPHKAV